MKKIFYALCLGMGCFGYAQEKPVPAFYKEMNSPHPNLYEVERLYEKYKQETPKTFNKEEIEQIQEMKAKSKTDRSSWLSNAKKENTPVKKEFRDEYEKDYIEWRKSIQAYIQSDGSIVYPTEEEIRKNFYKKSQDTPITDPSKRNEKISKDGPEGTASEASIRYGSTTRPYHSTFQGWRYFGIVHLNRSDNMKPQPSQANVRAFSQSLSNPNVVVCAVESGTVYISHNKGKMWHLATKDYNITGITALAISPNDENVIYASGSRHYVSRDGGVTWEDITNSAGFTALTGYPGPGNATSKIVVHRVDNDPINDIVLYATDKGLLKLTQTHNANAGVSYRFVRKLESRTTDIIRRTDSEEFFALGHDDTKNHLYFYSSTNGGENWQRKGENTGWYQPNPCMKESWGGRLAMSPNNDNVVYAYLIESRIDGDNGFLGVYKSEDGGENWFLPNPRGPGKGDQGYDNKAHPNLVTFPWVNHNAPSAYHQRFYNCAIIVNPNDVNDIILGGLTAWRSTDGGVTFNNFGGYGGDFAPFHPDMQTFYQQKNPDNSVDSWLTTDGGINYSNTFFANNLSEVRTAGLGSDYWGFDMGEYHTNMGGGMYHNGNNYYVSTYPEGHFKQAGGAENSTGYVFPNEDERHFYFSDLGAGIIASADYHTNHTRAERPDPVPSEPYAGGDVYYTQRDFRGNTYYFVKEVIDRNNTGKISLYRFNRLDKTTTLIKEHRFPERTSIDKYMVSFSHPRFQYIIIWDSNAKNTLYASEDGGATWEKRGKPFDENIVIALSDKDPKTFYALRRYRNGNSILAKTTDGGNTYTTIPSPDQSLSYKHIINVRGTDAIFLFGNSQSRVFYKLNDQTPWKEYSKDLPTNLNILEPKIQFRSGEFYMATSGAGIWTRELPEDLLAEMNTIKMNIDAPVKKSYEKDFEFQISDASLYYGKKIIKRIWEFPGAERVLNEQTDRPTVIYNQYGRFSVKLSLQDDKGNTYSQNFSNYISVYPLCSCDIPKVLKKYTRDIIAWVDAAKINPSTGSLTDKKTGKNYQIIGNNWTLETAENNNNQKVFSTKGDLNYIDLLTEYQGKTIFVVSKLKEQGNSMAFTFLLGSNNADFHSNGRLGPIFSNNWGEAKNIFRGNGASTMINNQPTDFFKTKFVTDNLAVYSLRTAENANPARVRYLSRDRGQPARTWLGEIAEVILLDRRLTDQEIQEINQYLLEKYGL